MMLNDPAAYSDLAPAVEFEDSTARDSIDALTAYSLDVGARVRRLEQVVAWLTVGCVVAMALGLAAVLA